MKRINLALAVAALAALMLVVVSSALAVTPAWVAQDTKKVVNKRLVFAGETVRATTARCEQETTTSFFCIVHLSGGVGQFSYVVTISGNNISWKLQR